MEALLFAPVGVDLRRQDGRRQGGFEVEDRAACRAPLGAFLAVPGGPQVLVDDVDEQAAGDVVQPAEAAASGLESGESGEVEAEEFELVEVGSGPAEEMDRRLVGRPTCAPRIL